MLPPEAVVVPYSSEEEWLELRRQFVTASEIGAIMGDSPYDTPRSIARKKLGITKPWLGNHLTRMGQLMEEANITAFAVATGWDLELTHAFLSRGPVSCTLDALVRKVDFSGDPRLDVEWANGYPSCPEGTILVLDGKNVRAGSEWTELPTYYWWQAQSQMYCTHLTHHIMMAKVDAHRLVPHYIEADPFAQEAMVERAQWFLDNMESIAK